MLLQYARHHNVLIMLTCKPILATEYKSTRVFSNFQRTRYINGVGIQSVHTWKHPGHGKSRIDAMGGQMKRNMRSFERQVGLLTNDRIPDFIEDQRYNRGQRRLNPDTLVHKIDFHDEKIVFYGGSMNFGYRVFSKMCSKQVVHRGVTYKCGIRNIRFCKITTDDDKAADPKFTYVFGNNVCLANCDTCFRSERQLCDRVVRK